VNRVLGAEEFDEIEFQAARTGNHVRAAVRMTELARSDQSGGISRAEAHLRAGEQWLMADDAEAARKEFMLAIEDGGSTFADPRVPLVRALLALDRADEAESLLTELRAEKDTAAPRTCDLLAELFADQGDLEAALDWATAGVDQYMKLEAKDEEDEAELALLLRLRYRVRNDLGLDEDDYDRLVDAPATRGGLGPRG
jgi:hypothetical protein